MEPSVKGTKKHGTVLNPFEVYINQKNAEPFFVPLSLA